MHAFAKPVLARSSAATLCLVLAGLLASCGGGGGGDPNQLTFDELVIDAGQERALSAERVTIRTRFDVKGTLALSLPPGSTADRVIVSLPSGTVIEGTIALRQPARVAAASAAAADHKQALASGVRPGAFVPRPVPSLIIEGLAGARLTILSTARLETPAGDDAPEEVLADLANLARGTFYNAASGGNGGDIAILTSGVVVFSLATGSPADAFFQPFAPGNGGKGADLVLNDGTWNDAGLTSMIVHAGSGGRSGRVVVDAAELHLDSDRPPAEAFTIYAASNSGVGGAGGKLSWDVVRPDLTSLKEVVVVGGGGGSGMVEGGAGGVARFAAGKPIVPATAPRPVLVAVLGGPGGGGGEDDSSPMVELPQFRTPKDPQVKVFGGFGGSLTAVAHTGWPGTRDHPDGYEPGALEAHFGSGGNASVLPLFDGRGGSGAGWQADVSRIRGGDGGDGWSACGEAQPTAGGNGGSSGHVTVRAGVGGAGPRGGNPGVLDYDTVELGKPGRGGNGTPGGAAGFYGQPQDAVSSDPFATEVRDDPGVRLVGVRSGESRDGTATHGSIILGAFVQPGRTAGEDCGPALPAGLIPLPAASYHGSYYRSNALDVVSELDESTSAGCLFLNTQQYYEGVGYIDPSQSCVTVHEVVRSVDPVFHPTCCAETITDKTLPQILTGNVVYSRARSFLLRQTFCDAEGNLVLPGSAGFTETFVEYDSNGDPLPSPAFVINHVASGPPIYPSEVNQTRNYCCTASYVYPNGRPTQFEVRTLSGGFCR